MNSSYDLIVIGAGPGGYEAALEAARLGLRTAIVEKDAVGGTCLNRGCIPTKTLMHSGDLCAQIRGASRFGIGAGEPAVDMEAVQRHKDETIQTLQKGILSLFKTRKVDLHQGIGTILPGAPARDASAAGDAVSDGSGVSFTQDAIHHVRVTAADGSETQMEAKRILLATGSVPSRPPIPGLDLSGVMTSDELLSYKGKPFGSLLIIGGGVIGIEFAGIYQNFGTKVTIVEALPSILANMDKELGQSLKLSLKKKGADIHTGASVQRIQKNADGTLTCVYVEKEKEQTALADAVLVAVGRRPYTAGVFAEGMEPSVERGRVLVNEAYETSVPGVYAIGDVSGKIQLAHAATAQGKRAVHVIAKELGFAAPGADPAEWEDLLIPSCVYTDPEIAQVGLTADQAKAAGLSAKSRKVLSSANGKSVLSLQERGFIKVVYLEDTHVILGAQLMCARATDMVSEFAAAIRQGMTMEQMADIVRPHPTFSEMITDATALG